MRKPIVLDGRTGEGGGQLVRVAAGLAALTGQPIKINNIRGNRNYGARNDGGLKSQHVTAIEWLAEVTYAETEGLSVGSKTLTFIPKRAPSELIKRNFKISAVNGAASTLLILQAILPFLLFAGNSSHEPIVLTICGGTNVSFSLSYEYLDQVLLPTLEERFDLQVEREVKQRSWSLGSQGRGEIYLKFYPLQPGQKLQFKWPTERPTYPASYQVRSVDVSIITHGSPQSELQEQLVENLGDLFPGADVNFKVVEDSGNVARWYILLVAYSTGGLRWGRDVLMSMPKKTKNPSVFSGQVARKICKELYDEVSMGGQVDEHLQDQLIIYQALSAKYSSMPRGDHPGEASPLPLVETDGELRLDEAKVRKEKTHEPFGHGSLHAQTARWVVSELLPHVKFFNKGDAVEGAGFSTS